MLVIIVLLYSVFPTFLQVDYPKAKKLNLTEFELKENEHFNFIKVNLNRSSVHVPTNVYDECKFLAHHIILISSGWMVYICSRNHQLQCAIAFHC